MKNYFVRRSLICGIIILLIGAAVLPIISGQRDIINNQTNNNELISFPIKDDDYLNAYWKFDECEGDILHDSSGHGYDGTIYGASWVSGYSGCALDFDGVDDYVDFDDHAYLELGFNKSDDMIFSLYFKSTSTDKGMIYGQCRGDAYGYNPGAHIALNANGTIELKVWRLGCGLLVCTQNSYNDGEWHYIEALYNGVYSHDDNCTGKIYVDGNLDGTSEYPVCAFYNDNFRYAKMGRHSYNSTDYFDGIIDEFKFIKYPGGNQRPSVSIIDGPTTGEPSVEYTYTFQITDPEGDDAWLNVDWGDGTYEEWMGPLESGVPIEVAHMWSEDGTYEIRAKAKDIWGEGDWSDPYSVKIGNDAPSAPTISGTEYGDVGKPYNYVFGAVDPDGDDIRYIIDWGDTTSDTTDYVASGTTETLSHTWTTGGTFTITAKAEDTFGNEGPETKKTVTMPRDKVLHITLFSRLLKQFPNAFPILRYILRL